MSVLRISDGELEVMKVLWERSPLSLPETVMEVQKTQSWEGGTIKTLLTRLVKKGAVKLEGVRRLYRYSPLVTREQYMSSASEQLLEKAFKGAPAAMLSFFVNHDKLSGDDIAELRRILDEAEAKQS